MAIDTDDAYIANGPSPIGFWCFGGEDIRWGGRMAGTDVGLYGQPRDPGPISGDPTSGNGGNVPPQVGVIGTSRGGPGVVGATSTSHGVFGQFRDPSGPPPPAGVCGSSQQAFGVVGVSSRLGGVFGRSDKFAGVFGSSSQSVGVGGRSDRSHGVFGLSFAPLGPNPLEVPAGVYGESMNGSIGVFGVPNAPGAGVVGVGTGGANAGVFSGNVVVFGKITATAKFPDGSKRLLHCMESPEHWFEDFGSARLTRGRVAVKLDAGFAEVVTLNGYRVFLTPEGDCQGLYVRSKRGTSFEVRELQGGTSNVAFSYRIVARRKDIKAHTRFAKIDTRLPIPTGKARAARGQQAARALLATLAKDAKIETTVPMPTGKARAARGRQAARLPSSIRALIAATALPIHTRKVRAARGRKAALPSAIRALLAEQRKRARKTRRKPAVRG